ncbi:MAG TPA: LolA-related protein [Burkholderiaceae bacterium]|nr:LolA-related protein [Burkholderiaceae bacterium]
MAAERRAAASARVFLAWIALLAAALASPSALAASAPSAAGWNLDALLAAIARDAPQRVRFVERHFIGVLDEPIDAAGELSWDPPDRLEKRTLQPRAERLSYERGVLTVERDGLRRSIELSAVPEAAALIESLRATLAGEREALERVFDVALGGGPQQWTLTLRPRDRAAGGLVQSIRLSGQAGAIDTVEVSQAGGDRSVMRILRDG